MTAAQTDDYPVFTSDRHYPRDPEPILPSGRVPSASPYQIGAQALSDHPEYAYLFFGGPVRPATDAEQAVYANRYGDEAYIDIYPAALPAGDAAAAPDDPDTGAGD